MNFARTLIASIVFLGLGLGLIFGFTHGTAGFSAAYPASGASLQLSINTTGMPAMAGFGATLLGTLLLLIALIQAIVAELGGAQASSPTRPIA
ncbi:MAG TPA: hypothetical protein VMX38_17985 [Verrucomicrobiae bacterium]|jgi:hypothetical protein|nr:hypothetical protein [Verrucomicrobiae bacterium]